MAKLYNYELTLIRNAITSKAMFALIGIIEQMESTSIFVPNKDQTKLIQLEKESVPVGIDYSDLIDKFYIWHYSKEETLTISVSESKRFMELWHIVMKQLKIQKYESGVNIDAMNIYYNSLLFTLVNIHKDKFIDKDGNYVLD